MISWFTFIFFISFVACCYHRVFFNFRLFHGWRFSESSGVLWYSGISCEGCGGPLTVRPACNKLSYKTTFAGCLIGIVFSARKKSGEEHHDENGVWYIIYLWELKIPIKTIVHGYFWRWTLRHLWGDCKKTEVYSGVFSICSVCRK